MSLLPRIVLTLALGLSLTAAQAREQMAAAQIVRFDVAAQPMEQALTAFAAQADLRIVFFPETVKGLTGARVSGAYTPQDALRILLANCGLTYKFTDARTVSVISAWATQSAVTEAQRVIEGLRLADSEVPAPQVQRRAIFSGPQSADDVPTNDAIPEVLVKGSKILNMDIARSRDDVLPYVIFDRATIERSGAANLNEFIRNRLTMNSAGGMASQNAALTGNKSSVNLRGLGENQTLILVDGHRIASSAPTAGTPQQADLNGIPLAAVERIEVLPTTASGIYGGSATGGVINVILRRDYSGIEMKMSYDNTFDSDSSIRRIDVSTGHNFEDGRTNLLVSGSFSDANPLEMRDRDFMQRGQARILANNPGFYLNAANPPLGARPNIRSVNGSPLFGPGTSNITSVPAGYVSANGLAPLQVNAGRYNLDLPDSAQGPSGARRSLNNNPTIASGMMTLRRKFGPKIDAFMELAISKNEGRFLNGSTGSNNSFTVQNTAPNNPFGQAIQVTVPSVSTDMDIVTSFQDKRAVGGVIAQLPREWRLSADYTFDRARIDWISAMGSTGLAAAVGNGIVDVLRDTILSPIDWSAYLNPPSRLLVPQDVTLRDVTLRFAGPVWALPAGNVMLSTLLEHRQENIDETYQYSSPTNTLLFPGRSQRADSAYAEFSLPLFAARTRRRGLEEFQLQIAARHDRYSTVGATGFVNNPTPTSVILREKNTVSSTDPTVGLRYKPVRDLMLRMSYGTGFLPPSVAQLLKTTPLPSSGSSFVDPARGNQPLSSYLLNSGGNPDLKPERSESISLGAVFTPRVLPELRLSVDYSRIEKTDNIMLLTTQIILDNPAILGSRVTRGANLSADQPGWSGPVTAVDASAVNISKAEVQTYDVALDYQWDLADWGGLALFANSTWQTHYKTQLAPSTPVVENVGIGSVNPLKFKANAGLTWTPAAWTVGWVTRYFDSYLVADPNSSSTGVTFLNQGERLVPDQIYHDMFVSYTFATGRQGWNAALEGLEMKAGLSNVFNARPPFDAGATYYYSVYGDPRLRTYSLSARMAF